MTAVLFDHGCHLILIVDGFVQAAHRIGQSLQGEPNGAFSPNPCGALACCVASLPACPHGLSAILAVIGDGGVSARCGECWPGTEPPERCPTCRSAFTDPLWMAGLLTGCSRCGELFVSDYLGQVRVVQPELLAILGPGQRQAIELVRERMTRAGASA